MVDNPGLEPQPVSLGNEVRCVNGSLQQSKCLLVCLHEVHRQSLQAAPLDRYCHEGQHQSTSTGARINDPQVIGRRLHERRHGSSRL